MTLDTQFGGHMIGADGSTTDLGNTLKDYFRVFIPGAEVRTNP